MKSLSFMFLAVLSGTAQAEQEALELGKAMTEQLELLPV